jgi:TolB-like protein/Flp pilus assembly protein TadD
LQGVEKGYYVSCNAHGPAVFWAFVTTDSIDELSVRRALEHVLSSAAFSRNERQSKFLKFLVQRHLEGRGNELKESVIAVEVFHRKPDYDPKLDAIVRTEAVRLRARLNKYYAAEGRLDPITFELPKGGYRPVFHARTETQAPPERTSRGLWWTTGLLVAVATAAVATWWWASTVATSPTVAVLPLENLSHDPARDYVADGLTDEIIRNLSVIDGLTVRSRTSSFALKGKQLSASEAGKQLGADYLVEGSVLQDGQQVRVNAVLIRVRDDRPLWSGRFDRALTDLFAIQDEVSRGIVNSLRLQLTPGRRRYEANLQAYDLYLRGRHAMEGFPAVGRPTVKIAVGYFEQAIAKDANYALAYAAIADTFLAVDNNIIAPEAYPRAKAAAQKAIALDPLLSEAQSAMASIHAREHAWQDAERGFRRAIELNPNNALARLGLAVSVLVMQGRFEEGLEEARRAVALDPLSPYTHTEFARALLLAGRYDEAIDQSRKAIALDPERNRPYFLMARALSLHGKPADAVTVFEDRLERDAPPRGPAWLACAYMRAGRHDDARAVLQRELAAAAPARLMAGTYACVGDKERALQYLEQTLAEHQPGLAELLQAPELAGLRADPRFAKVRQEANLSP